MIGSFEEHHSMSGTQAELDGKNALGNEPLNLTTGAKQREQVGSARFPSLAYFAPRHKMSTAPYLL